MKGFSKCFAIVSKTFHSLYPVIHRGGRLRRGGSHQSPARRRWSLKVFRGILPPPLQWSSGGGLPPLRRLPYVLQVLRSSKQHETAEADVQFYEPLQFLDDDTRKSPRVMGWFWEGIGTYIIWQIYRLLSLPPSSKVRFMDL